MAKKDIDWGNLTFSYQPTDKRFVANYKDGKWDEGQLTTDANITMNECACVLQYAQSCFEGLKAYTTADGKIVCFRPDLNAVRMEDSARRLKMPPFSAERFLDAIKQVVKANAQWVPPTVPALPCTSVLTCSVSTPSSASSPLRSISSAPS